MASPTLLITGATGSVGRHLIAALAQRGLAVRASTRDPTRASVPEGVELVRADLAEPASMRAALAGVARVFLYAALADADAMAALFRDTSVRHIVMLSSSSAASDGTAEGDFNAQRFRAFESAVAAVGVDTTFLRPGEFSSNALGWRHSIKASRTIRLPYPDAVQTPIDQRDIADVAVHALTTDALRNQAPLLTGPARVTIRDEVNAIAAALGSPIELVVVPEAETIDSFAQHMPRQYAELVVGAWRRAQGATPTLSPCERYTGSPGRSFAQWALHNADRFR